MKDDLKGLILAILLSTLVLVGWQFFYESPQKAKKEDEKKIAHYKKLESDIELQNKINQNISVQQEEPAGRVTINSARLSGSISLKGLRFDDLKFRSYHETLSANSPLEHLFIQNGDNVYFAEFGWIHGPQDQAVPDKNSIWQCDNAELTASQAVNCFWKNSSGIDYSIKISLDDNYLFTIKQGINNNSGSPISLAYYGRIYKSHAEPKQFAILHEGAIGVFAGVLKESTYEDISKSKQDTYENTKGSWAGITNKYFLSAIIPDSNFNSKTNFIASENAKSSKDVYNINYVSTDATILSGKQLEYTNYLFAGAKEEKLLNEYSKKYDFTLFDRAIDFGFFFFITKPIFWLISYLYSILGNFGLAIIGVTFFLKLLMYPLSAKSSYSMLKMKALQPQLAMLKEKYGDDKIKLNQEMMLFYKQEKINPAAGCLPILIQIPLFFSLYKVIFLSIEMRHAPFYGWIKDLSAPDPTSIWNLFGVMPWNTPGFLDIGIWPIIMALTMFVQQKMSPAPTDPIQAGVMKFMPLVLVVMLYSLPSGLMIYWSFSNILSILQQYLINKTITKPK